MTDRDQSEQLIGMDRHAQTDRSFATGDECAFPGKEVKIALTRNGLVFSTFCEPQPEGRRFEQIVPNVEIDNTRRNLPTMIRVPATFKWRQHLRASR